MKKKVKRYKKEKNKKNQRVLFTSVLAIGIVSLVIISIFFSIVVLNKSAAVQGVASTKQSKGLQVSRDFIISSLQQTVSTINFEPAPNVNNQESYIASENGNTMQITGPADNLTEVTCTAILGNVTAESINSLVYLVGIPNIIDVDGKTWIISAIQDAKITLDDGEIKVERVTFINNRKYDLIVYKKDSNLLASVTITPANE